MPAYNYFPATYNPYLQSYPTYQPTYQPVQTVQPQMQQTAQSNQPTMQTGIIWVNNESEAQMYPIAPNNAVSLWEKSGKTIYLKKADMTGKPTITIYDLVERKPDQTDTTETTEKKPDYATKEDLDAVAGAVRCFDDLIGSIRSDIDTIKSDMYGIAGKKKHAPVKQKEDDDE